jgi:hypothetical protein
MSYKSTRVVFKTGKEMYVHKAQSSKFKKLWRVDSGSEEQQRHGSVRDFEMAEAGLVANSILLPITPRKSTIFMRR